MDSFNIYILSKLKKVFLLICLFSVEFYKGYCQCTFSLGPDTTVCQGQVISIPITGPAGYNSYNWSTGSSSQNITVNAAGTYICNATILGSNLVTNGDFSSGNSGFTSSYVVGTGGSWGPVSAEGTYLVTPNPNVAHTNFPYFGDHTSGIGNMMVVNGAGVANTSIWCQTIPVTPNTTFNFSTWVATSVASNLSELAMLQFSINGNLLGSVFSPPLIPGQWSQFNATWNSGINTTATICIENQCTVLSGNDFALDDIFFQQVCSYSDTLIVESIPLPNISVTGPFTLDCTSTPVTLSGNSTTTGAIYNWTGPSSFYSTLQNPTTTVAGTYTLTITEPLKHCSSNATVTVNSSTQLNISAGSSQTINCLHPTVNISASSSSNGVIYSWTGPGLFSSSLQNPMVNLPGTYTVTVTDSAGICKATANVLVNIDTAAPIISVGPDLNLSCKNPSVTLSGSSSIPGIMYLWSGPAQQTSVLSSISTNIPGTYTLTVTNPLNGCSSKDIAVVYPAATGPVSNFFVTHVTCNGGNDGSANIYLTGGTPPFTYLWSNNPLLNSSVITGLNAAIYTCNVVDSNGCKAASTFTILEPPPLSINPIPPLTVCPGQQVNLSALVSGGTPPYTYIWSDAASNPISNPFSPSTSAQYLVSATDSNGCHSLPMPFSINLYPPPAVSVNSPSAICYGSYANVTATVSGGTGNYTYLWMPGNFNTATVQLYPNQTATYTLTLTDACGQTQKQVTVVVNPRPFSPIKASDTSGCAPLCIDFSGNNSAAYNFTWSTSNNLLASGNNFSYCFAPGTYTVNLIVSDALGCKDSSNLTINSFVVPKAQFYFENKDLSIFNPEVHFINTSYNATNYIWHFGDNMNTQSNSINPFFLYPGAENCYPVSLIASNVHCRDTANELVCIKDIFTIYFPNAFTPNNDGLNDIWLPLGTGIDEHNFNLIIYDRWGNLVFDTDIWGKGWNGVMKDKNDIVQEDVYVWKTKLKDRFGNPHQYNGIITLCK